MFIYLACASLCLSISVLVYVWHARARTNTIMPSHV